MDTRDACDGSQASLTAPAGSALAQRSSADWCDRYGMVADEVASLIDVSVDVFRDAFASMSPDDTQHVFCDDPLTAEVRSGRTPTACKDGAADAFPGGAACGSTMAG